MTRNGDTGMRPSILQVLARPLVVAPAQAAAVGTPLLLIRIWPGWFWGDFDFWLVAWAAICIGLLTGGITADRLARRFVFPVRWRDAWRPAVDALVGLALSAAVSVAGASVLHARV